MKAGVQIRLGGTKRFHKVGVDGKYNPFVNLAVNLRQVMALILIDKEDISRKNIVKPVVNQKLFSAGNGVINFIAIMDVHIHGFFVTVKMCKGKILFFYALLNGFFAGV